MTGGSGGRYPGSVPRLAELATIVLSPSGCVTSWSFGAQHLFGHAAEQAMGWDIHELFTELRRETVAKALAKVAAGRVWAHVVRLECADGRVREVEFRWEPLASTDGDASVLVSAGFSAGRDLVEAALTLQQGLLPGDLTAPPGCEIAYRYLPVNEAHVVGGDWCDAIALPDGRAAFVVGDTMGHDIHSAAAMGQLRTALRVLSDFDLPPTEVLTRLDRVAESLHGVEFATCLYAVCDPATRSCVVACAGHETPLVAHADGSSDKLALPPGLPLGSGSLAGDLLDPFEATELTLPVGSTLVLYTDGLVERRRRNRDAGTSALRATLARPRTCLEATCDAIMEALGANQQDDITFLLARMDPAASGAAPQEAG